MAKKKSGGRKKRYPYSSTRKGRAKLAKADRAYRKFYKKKSK